MIAARTLLSFVGACTCLALSSCVLLAYQGASPADPAEAQRMAEEDAARQAEADRQRASELDRLKLVALAEDASLDDAISYCDKLGQALREGAIDRGGVSATHADECWTALDAQAGKLGASATIEVTRGFLRLDQGRPDEAAAHLFAAIQLEPTYERFTALLPVPRSATRDSLVVQACPLVRPAIPSELVPDMVAACLDAAGGDRRQLSWKSAPQDLQAHDVELARRAEELRVAADQAELAAAAAAQSQLWALAAVFAAGNCRFSNCLKDGWESSTDQGSVTTSCRFSNCLKDGWETRFPDGSTATTSCRFSDCMKDGWETRFPDGSTATTSCRFSNCSVDGWETRLPDGSTATTSCKFSKCFTDGWETRMPDRTVSCACKFSDCLANGTSCS